MHKYNDMPLYRKNQHKQINDICTFNSKNTPLHIYMYTTIYTKNKVEIVFHGAIIYISHPKKEFIDRVIFLVLYRKIVQLTWFPPFLTIQ